MLKEREYVHLFTVIHIHILVNLNWYEVLFGSLTGSLKNNNNNNNKNTKPFSLPEAEQAI